MVSVGADQMVLCVIRIDGRPLLDRHRVGRESVQFSALSKEQMIARTIHVNRRALLYTGFDHD